MLYEFALSCLIYALLTLKRQVICGIFCAYSSLEHPPCVALLCAGTSALIKHEIHIHLTHPFTINKALVAKSSQRTNSQTCSKFKRKRKRSLVRFELATCACTCVYLILLQTQMAQCIVKDGTIANHQHQVEKYECRILNIQTTDNSSKKINSQ